MRNFVRLVGRLQNYREIKVGNTILGKLTIRQAGRKKSDGTAGDGMFFDVDVWGVDNYLSAKLNKWVKSQDIQVVGRLEQQRWEKDGKQQSKVIVKCDARDVAFFATDFNDGPKDQPKKKEYVPEPETDNDIPF